RRGTLPGLPSGDQQRRPARDPGRAGRRGRSMPRMRTDPRPRRGRRLMGWVAEADGGSRGNPGPAAYGAALFRDGVLIADRGETIGRATNNVAEYRGLIAALELAREHAGGAPVEVRMDSKLVIEQMAGRWKIKHPDMIPLASRAQTIVRDLGPVTWTWVPRAQNARADALANAALDEQKAGRPGLVSTVRRDAPVQLADEPPEAPADFTEPRDAAARSDAKAKNP